MGRTAKSDCIGRPGFRSSVGATLTFRHRPIEDDCLFDSGAQQGGERLRLEYSSTRNRAPIGTVGGAPS
jgi:hypothetical protein